MAMGLDFKGSWFNIGQIEIVEYRSIVYNIRANPACQKKGVIDNGKPNTY